MRQTHLELYRWKWHNEVYLQFKRVQAAKSQMRPSAYWREYGAFVSVLPRQVGKTLMLKTMIQEITKLEGATYLVVCPSSSMAQHFIQKTGLPANHVTSVTSWLSQNYQIKQTPNVHLFVDEFDHVSKGDLSRLLDVYWASVNMASTLR